MTAVHNKLDLHQFRNFSMILMFSGHSSCRELNNINKPGHFKHTYLPEVRCMLDILAEL